MDSPEKPYMPYMLWQPHLAPQRPPPPPLAAGQTGWHSSACQARSMPCEPRHLRGTQESAAAAALCSALVPAADTTGQ